MKHKTTSSILKQNFKAVVLRIVASFTLFLTCSGLTQAQEEQVSDIIISDFTVSEIVNDPETMNIEGFFLEFNITNSDNLTALTFEVQRNTENGEPDNTQYQLEVLKKENGIYLVIQNNHFQIKNGIVQMHISCDPKPIIDNIVYSLSGFDRQGFSINKAEYSQFQ